MQPPDPAIDGTPYSTPLASTEQQAQSPVAGQHRERDPDPTGPLVAQAAKRVADAINDLKRELDHRDGTSARARGKLLITLNARSSPSYELSIVPSEEGEEFPVHVQVKLETVRSAIDDEETDPIGTPTIVRAASSYKPARRDSDTGLEKDLVSRKRRRIDEGEESTNKRMRAEEHHVVPRITKEDMEDIVSRLREDIQEDTTECVNHVQKLLRRFKEEWHEKSRAERSSLVGFGATPDASFPSPGVDRAGQDLTIPELIHKESKLIGSRIRWVEECRRVAADIHDKREENWRTTSASFHDRARQDRESFQSRMLHESAMHTQKLDQLLNEVKTIALYTQSMKWETPTYPQPPPVAPSFPTLPPPPAATRGWDRGRGN